MSATTAGSATAATVAGSASLRVAVIGCGLVGERRARAASSHDRTRLSVVVDLEPGRASAVSGGAARALRDWRAAIDSDADVIVVSTPNGLLADITVAALEAGKHVLMEKPMGRSLAEASRIADAATRSGRVLGVGFNHRFHPALGRTHAVVNAGELGRLISLRARYGHGGRPGLEREWRSDPEQSGGGELIDQGVHIADLFHWLVGMPAVAFACLQTAVWRITPLEDNAYGLLRFPDGAVAQLHASMTQWKNLFSLEVHGEAGAVVVDGLGGSYGTERFTRIERAFEGGAPAVREEVFDGPDASWVDEWAAFVARIDGRETQAAGIDDGVAAMRIIDALYRSARSGEAVAV